MTELTEEQKEAIEAHVRKHAVPSRLPAHLTLQVLALVATLAVGAAAIVSVGFVSWAASVAEDTARDVALEKALEVSPKIAPEVAQNLSVRSSFIEAVGDLVLFPPGAVVAFASECPNGWSVYGPSEGRMILGVGGGYTLLSRGGAEMHALTIAEMPSHGHALHPEVLLFGPHPESDMLALNVGREYPVIRVRNLDRENIPSPTYVGSGQPHNNMPPYIALYFCKKVAG